MRKNRKVLSRLVLEWPTAARQQDRGHNATISKLASARGEIEDVLVHYPASSESRNSLALHERHSLCAMIGELNDIVERLEQEVLDISQLDTASPAKRSRVTQVIAQRKRAKISLPREL